jgi:hypothetical protein
MSSSPMSKIGLLKAAIRKASKDSVITCTAIRKIAEDNNATYAEAGDAADRLDIKIRECELGCF